MTGSTQHSTTADNVASLGWIAECLNVLARCGHERLTVQQALFFAATAYHRKLGEVVTVPDLRAKHPLGRSIEKSKFQLSEPSMAFPEALGWLQQETDPDDARRRYLSLTEAGAGVLDAMPSPPERLSIALIRERLREARRGAKRAIEP